MMQRVDDSSRECPVCGARFPVPAARRGRPQVYCSQQCRWRRGHEEAAEQRRELIAARAEWTSEELLAWIDAQDFGDFGP